VVLASRSGDDWKIRVLSQGLFAAGEPVLSYDGRRVVFAGKKAPDTDWQIYETRPQGGSIKVLTAAVDGAADPALLPDGSLLYISPVPKAKVGTSELHPSAIYVQASAGQPRRLTFTRANVLNPTVLSDGRILFVSSQPPAEGNSRAGLALYTVNNDGTEVTAFAGQHDEPLTIQRPRQLKDGRIVFLVADQDKPDLSRAEYVLSAHPFSGRISLFSDSSIKIRSVEPDQDRDLLVCAAPEASQSYCSRSWAVFRLNSTGSAPLGTPIFVDPDWDTIESISVAASPRPMGRLSSVDLSRKTGQILCLDANNTTDNSHASKATRIRIFAQGITRARLGEVDLQPDGSFMAEVPADLPLGFEALDEHGRVLRRVEPMIWVRPGENRSCIGCHEPHNHSPRNFRPLAVRVPVPKLLGDPAKLSRKSPDS
jgi:hypothetical protein